MKREAKLLKNIFIYAMGNFGSKALSILLVPMYTYYLSVSQYGYYDIINSSLMLFLPIISFQISDGVYRFLLDCKTEKEMASVVTNAFIVVLRNLIIANLLLLIIMRFVPIQYSYLILLQFDSFVIYTLVMETCRAMKKSFIYSMSGMVNTAVILSLNLFLIMVMGLKINALLISNSAAYLIVTVYILFNINFKNLFHFKLLDKRKIREIELYSLPLIPNVVSWWFMNVSDRFLIKLFLGMDANGIYAISNKFSAILMISTSIFYLAWQQSSIEEYSSQDKNIYYTKMFNSFLKIEMSAIIFLLAFTKVIVQVMASKNYYSAVNYVPCLYLGVAFSSFSSFYGTGYQASKETKGAFFTSVFGGIINVLINLFLIPLLGIQGASISTMVAFFIMWCLRIFQTRKYFSIRINIKSSVVLFGICSIMILFYYFNNPYVNLLIMVLGSTVFVLFNYKYLLRGMSYVRNKLSRS